MFSNQNQQKISENCKCIYSSSRNNYNEHLLSRKHQKSMLSNENQQKISENQQKTTTKFWFLNGCYKKWK